MKASYACWPVKRSITRLGNEGQEGITSDVRCYNIAQWDVGGRSCTRLYLGLLSMV